MTVSTSASFSGCCVLPHRVGGLGAERLLALDQRHEARAGDREEPHARIERADELVVASGLDGGLRGQQPDAPVAGRLDGGVGLGCDHADDRHREALLQLRQSGRGRGVAGRDDQLHALRLEEAGDLAGEAADLVERPRAVGEPRVVAEVDEVLVRHRHEALVEDGEAAHARVEDADGPGSTRAIVGLGRICR